MYGPRGVIQVLRNAVGGGSAFLENSITKGVGGGQIPRKKALHQCSAQVFKRAGCHLKRAL